MNPKQKWFPVAIIAAIPAGMLGGYHLGSLLFLGILRLKGLASPQADSFISVLGGMLGATCGMIALPIAVWLLMREPRK